MTKSSKKPPKYCRNGKYAIAYIHGKKHYLGLYKSPESMTAYARLIAEIRDKPIIDPPKGEPSFSVKELVAAFLDHAKETLEPTTYDHYRILTMDFLLKLYGADTPVDEFKPKALKLVRAEMIESQRFCRNVINRHTGRIVSIFEWGVSEELVLETTHRALKTVKFLPKGYPGTFDNPERENVPDDIVRRTLPFMPPILRAMIQIQWLTGMRPSEVFNMRVGDIDKTRKPGLWHYTPRHHKTEEHIGKKSIPLGKPEQELLAPYLVGKTSEQSVFNPNTAMAERKAEKQANRKSKRTPSQTARDKARAAKPRQYAEFYNRFSYRQAVEYAIEKANRHLPDGEKIPRWTPYQLRHSAGTVAEEGGGLDKAQALLGHKTPNVTRRYAHAQLAIAEDLARNRCNPFSQSDEKMAG
jgi:integrase